ncbi:hypothetical protein [Nocardiopsis protaetiae]|uniref:hypothetical protein n=1 Tax=Nocardiopsis protaetiae TaxID=3382270 RepID=UPI00387AB558
MHGTRPTESRSRPLHTPETTPEAPYESPTVTCLGEVRDVVLGSGSQDTADMNTSRYW